MIFISGINRDKKDLEFSQTIVCPKCGAYDRISSFMTYNRLSIFFIPVFRWNKKYYIETRCCKSVFSVSTELGRDMERGISVTLGVDDLKHTSMDGFAIRKCINCGRILKKDYEYCPKCGNKI